MVVEVCRPRRWTRAEYHQLADDGYFRPDEKLELLDGEIVTVTPQRSRHAAVVDRAQGVLQAAFDVDYRVRSQLPLALNDLSEPEPDLAVVPGGSWDYLEEHPRTALLVVEVAETSLGQDRLRKASLYAQAGIAEYWIVNLVDGLLEVYREPVAMGTGWDYRLVQRLGRQDVIAPLAKPEARIAITDLLPPSQAAKANDG